MSKLTKVLAATLAVSVLLAGCGAQNTADYIKQNYSLENVEGQGDVMQKVYRAPGESVSSVAKKLAAERQPEEMSKESEERMFIVYPDTMVQVQQDPENPEDTLVEVNTKEFVRQNYDPSFLEGFLAAAFISSMFGSNWRTQPHGGYYGYGRYKQGYGTPAPSTGGGTYRPPTNTTPSYKTPPRSNRGTGRVIRR